MISSQNNITNSHLDEIIVRLLRQLSYKTTLVYIAGKVC